MFRRFVAARVHRGIVLSALLALLTAATPLADERNPSATSRSSAIAEPSSPPAPPELANLEWRNVGPAYPIGRVADVEGVPGDPDVVYVGSASGGVWKTVNGGTTWTPVFDEQPVLSIGDIALEPGNPDVVYAGTGEGNPRNSVSFGNGVYKSTDGGKTWRHLGLEKTRYITRLLVSPRDRRTVFVGALGSIFGSGPDRGVFRSEDGGETWQKVLYVDDRHGVADMDLDPQNPNVVFAAMWLFERRPWTHRSGSDKGGVFRSVDGGKTWKKLERGLPSLLGRIAVKVAPGNPRVVYVLAESHEGTLFRSTDGGDSFTRVSDESGIISRGFYYTDLRVDPADENRVYAVASLLQVSIDGGKTFRRISSQTHVDFHSLWIDPLDPNRMWQGQDGGVAVSRDRGEKWDAVNNFTVAQFYQVMADNREPFYYVGGGLQDNGVWRAPSRTREPGGILNDDWRIVSFGDGFTWLPDPADPDVSLSLSQGGNLLRTDMRTREQQVVSPQARRNDGGPARDLRYRFNWNAPLVASPHDRRTVYLGGNVVFRSPDFGSTWNVISPDLTTNDPTKLETAGGPAWMENTTAEYHCTIVSLAESPAQAGVLWAGTDDGDLHVSRDGGGSWDKVTANVKGIEPGSPVSHVEPSRAAAGASYVAFDRHMFDDFRPYIFKTTDFGKTWTRATGNLPEGAWVWVIREDPKVPRLIYAGTEIGLFVSRDDGTSWFELALKNLPSVSVHDLYVHPRENDLIVGTHGRGMYILDDATPIQQLGSDVLSKRAHLFAVRRAWRFTTRMTRYGLGDRAFRGPNPPPGALITYYLRERPAKEVKVTIEVLDAAGTVVRELKKVPAEAGLNRTNWDLTYEPARRRRADREEDDSPFMQRLGPRAVPGIYRVRLTVGTETFEQPVEVRLDPQVQVPAGALERQFEMALETRDMESSVNDAVRLMDSVKDQLSDRRRTAQAQTGGDAPAELAKALDEFGKRLEALAEHLARPVGTPAWGRGPRSAERLAQFGSMIGGVNAAPTEAQAAYFEELERETRAAPTKSAELNGLVEEINAALARFDLPPVKGSASPP
jgi:photosystem II stability/assembly factor-like uncharacterized protein